MNFIKRIIRLLLNFLTENLILMKKLILILGVLTAPFFVNAQTTNYGNGTSTTGNKSSYFGENAGGSITTGHSNTFIGHESGVNVTNGRYNSCLGSLTGQSLTTGLSNNLIGNQSGLAITSGDYNVCFGNNSGRAIVGGNNNTMIGHQTGFKTTGSHNVFLGHKAGYNETGSNKLYISNSSTTQPLIYGNFSTKIVGIAIDPAADLVNTADYGLYVGKGILAEKVKVATRGTQYWADFVFEEDYDLNEIEEVEAFVKENKHLPNVPSTEDVNANGIDLAKMDATLLRQIEELWLHMIEMKKENEQLQDTINELEDELKALKK